MDWYYGGNFQQSCFSIYFISVTLRCTGEELVLQWDKSAGSSKPFFIKGVFMTRCEQLYGKANRCICAARRTEGKMRDIWLFHYNAIIDKIKSMTIQELSEEVK